MLPKVSRRGQGHSKCKIVLQTQKSAQKVLSAIGKGLIEVEIKRICMLYSLFEGLEILNSMRISHIYVIVCYSYVSVSVCNRTYLYVSVRYLYVSVCYSYASVCCSYVLVRTRMLLVCHS